MTEAPVVWLLDPDAHRRHARADALRATGLVVVPVGSFGEIVRWPLGNVVVVDEDRYTPWWKTIGATHVIVLAESAEDDNSARFEGADAWLPQWCDDDDLAGVIWKLANSDKDDLPIDESTN